MKLTDLEGPTRKFRKKYTLVLPAKRKAPQPRPSPPNPYQSEYWYDPRIHNWGNIGIRGFFHAFFAPLATWIIDCTSYSGLDIRKRVHGSEEYFPQGASVLDLCCGTGFSTAPGAVGVDTSKQMLSIASIRRPDASFQFGNAESFGESDSFDVVSIMFATHEMPQSGRRRVLRNAMRVAKKQVVVVDIDPDFEDTLKAKPLQGEGFLAGEPYVLGYLAGMDDDVKSCAPIRIAQGRSWSVKRDAILPKHVVVWKLEKLDLGSTW